VKKWILAGLVVAMGLTPPLALAQTSSDSAPPPAQRDSPPAQRESPPAQGEERMLVGQVQSVDDSGTELTLMDGTKLLTPPGARLRPGLLNEGMLIVAMYREENGDKILTRIALGQSESAPGSREGSPKQSPEDAPKQSPADTPKRY